MDSKIYNVRIGAADNNDVLEVEMEGRSLSTPAFKVEMTMTGSAAEVAAALRRYAEKIDPTPDRPQKRSMTDLFMDSIQRGIEESNPASS